MKRIALLALIVSPAYGHNVITAKVTFDREIIRLFNTHCISCHRSNGPAHRASSTPSRFFPDSLRLAWELYSFVGIIMLIGIVKKNAIMMIDFALETMREHGTPAAEAIVEACLVRFRPIMRFFPFFFQWAK